LFYVRYVAFGTWNVLSLSKRERMCEEASVACSKPKNYDTITVVVVRQVCLDSWWSYGGFSRHV